MHPDLDRALCERHPALFADRHTPTSGMAWGFACGDGWFSLLDVLCESLQAETDQHGAPQLVARHAKEKFGGLRFFAPGASPRQRAMIELAQRLSQRTCELCGAPGQIYGPPPGRRGWVRSRCPAHENDSGR